MYEFGSVAQMVSNCYTIDPLKIPEVPGMNNDRGVIWVHVTQIPTVCIVMVRNVDDLVRFGGRKCCGELIITAILCDNHHAKPNI